MYTSDTDPRFVLRRDAKRYFIAALGCVVFSVIYEYFSHSVYSLYMICLFLYPLLLGAVPSLALMQRGAVPTEAVRRVWRAGVWTLAFGSLMTGVFEIYGSPSPLTVIYWPVGAALLIAGGAMWAAEARRNKIS